MVLKTIIISVVFIAIIIALIGIKMFLKKDGEFKKECSSVDPITGQKLGCTCDKPDSEKCENKK